MYTHMYIYIYTYIHICIHICIYGFDVGNLAGTSNNFKQLEIDCIYIDTITYAMAVSAEQAAFGCFIPEVAKSFGCTAYVIKKDKKFN